MPNRRLAVLVTVIACAAMVSAQRPPDIPLTPTINREVVLNTIKAINKYYLSADVAKALEAGLRARLEGGEYDAVKSAFDLVDALDLHMQDISKDAHLKLAYSHRPGAPVVEIGDNIKPETAEERAESLAEARQRNYGFEKIERLPGGIGLLELNSFVRPEFSGATAGAAMSFLAASDALIIDLRASRGGSPDMVVFLASYFFPGDEAYRLGDWETRVEGGTQQIWTYPYVPGERFLDKDVYVLTAKRTFSAPEGLAAFLQHHKKATVVGEPTGGGTHPGVMVRVHPHFAVFVPVSMPVYPTGTPTYPLARPVYPERKPDTAGQGIRPDVEVAADRALDTARLLALEKKLKRSPSQKEVLQPLIEKLRADLKR